MPSATKARTSRGRVCCFCSGPVPTSLRAPTRNLNPPNSAAAQPRFSLVAGLRPARTNLTTLCHPEQIRQGTVLRLQRSTKTQYRPLSYLLWMTWLGVLTLQRGGLRRRATLSPSEHSERQRIETLGAGPAFGQTCPRRLPPPPIFSVLWRKEDSVLHNLYFCYNTKLKILHRNEEFTKQY